MVISGYYGLDVGTHEFLCVWLYLETGFLRNGKLQMVLSGWVPMMRWKETYEDTWRRWPLASQEESFPRICIDSSLDLEFLIPELLEIHFLGTGEVV